MSVTIALLAAVAVPGLTAQEAPAATPPEQVWAGLLAAGARADWGPPQNEAASRMLRQLSHPDFAKREEATVGLKKMGPGVFRLLGAEYGASRDLEKRLRIREIAVELYMLARVPWFDDGFLGIHMDRDERGVLVNQVLPGSAAEAGGLQRGDLIIELDGERVPIISEVEGQTVPAHGDLTFLQKSISARKSGEHVELLVVRRGQVLRFRIALGRRKAEYLRPQFTPYSDRLAELEQADGEFERFWTEHFEAAEEAPASPDPAP